jgi:hypothetical protein
MSADDQAAATTTEAPATYRFDVERRVENVFEKYVGWIVAGTVEAEFDVQALRRVVVEGEAPGRYRVIRHDGRWLSVSEFDVTRRTEWDIERVES